MTALIQEIRYEVIRDGYALIKHYDMPGRNALGRAVNDAKALAKAGPGEYFVERVTSYVEERKVMWPGDTK